MTPTATTIAQAELFRKSETQGDQLEALWAKRETENAKKWTTEARCALWWQGGGAEVDWPAWHQLPEYQRRQWLGEYEYHQHQPGPMPTAGHVHAANQEQHRTMERMAKSWAAEIREAFLSGRPCPIKPEPRFEYVLRWAFEIAQVPQQCLPAAVE